VRAVAELDFQ